MARVQPEALRRTLIEIYGEALVVLMESAPRPDGREDPRELTREVDIIEAQRFAAELERDAAMGSHADWPDL